jgi:hypothetical protein
MSISAVFIYSNLFLGSHSCRMLISSLILLILWAVPSSNRDNHYLFPAQLVGLRVSTFAKSFLELLACGNFTAVKRYSTPFLAFENFLKDHRLGEWGGHDTTGVPR